MIKEGKLKDEPSRNKKIKSEIAELQEEFYISEIAKKYGVSVKTIEKLILELKREGLSRNKSIER